MAIERTLLKCEIACGNSHPVSLGNHGLEIIFASVFYSCRSPTLVLTWPITIMHRFFSRLAGYSTELALGIEGCFVRMRFLDMNDFSSYSLGGKLESSNPKTSCPAWKML